MPLKAYACSPNFADAEQLFSELGHIITVDKMQLRDSSITHDAVIAADVGLKRHIASEGRGEAGVPSRGQERFVDPDGVLKRLRSIDTGKRTTEDADPDFVLAEKPTDCILRMALKPRLS